MVGRRAEWPPRLWRVEFQRRKYGPELLIDAAYISAMPAFKPTSQPHSLTFYDILLVTRGRGTYYLDDERHRVAPGTVLITRPGQIRRWEVEHLDGACVFFTLDFIREVFADARFLDQFAYWRPRRATGAMVLPAAERRQYLRRFALMAQELAEPRADASDLLRARLYEMLVLLNRWYLARHPSAVAGESHGLVDRFQAMVERDFRRQQRVNDYASRLRVSPGHLNVLCRAHLGHSASAEIHRRLVLEAKRMLLYTNKPAFAVAAELGFADPAYFGRFFRRESGETPRQFRRPGAVRDPSSNDGS